MAVFTALGTKEVLQINPLVDFLSKPDTLLI